MRFCQEKSQYVGNNNDRLIGEEEQILNYQIFTSQFSLIQYFLWFFYA